MTMSEVTITMDGRTLTVPAGSTILEAARANDIRIPTLCFLEKLDPRATCRMCVVEVEGARTFQHACAAKVRDGMVIHTDTEAVRRSRKMTLQLLLSDHNVDCHHCLRIGSSRCEDLDPRFCEMCFFCDCVRDGFCELQALAREYGVDQLPFPQKHDQYPVDDSSVIIRDPNKCIKCKRCVDVCGSVQTVNNLAASGRGSGVLIGPAFNSSMADSRCIGCSRCVEVCPTGAIHVLEHKDEIVYHAHQWGTTSIAMVDGALMGELDRIRSDKSAPLSTGVLAGSLKKIGFDHVVDAEDMRDAAAAEAEDLLDARLAKGAAILTDSRAGRELLKREYGGSSEQFVFAPSPLSVFGSLAKKAFGDGDGPVKTCAFGPLGPDAAESAADGCTDYVVNARELYRIMLRTGSEPHAKRTAETETLPHRAASGKYGHLLEAAEWNMEKQAETFDMTVDGRTLHCAICHNPAQLRTLLDSDTQADVIRVIV